MRSHLLGTILVKDVRFFVLREIIHTSKPPQPDAAAGGVRLDAGQAGAGKETVVQRLVDFGHQPNVVGDALAGAVGHGPQPLPLVVLQQQFKPAHLVRPEFPDPQSSLKQFDSTLIVHVGPRRPFIDFFVPYGKAPSPTVVIRDETTQQPVQIIAFLEVFFLRHPFPSAVAERNKRQKTHRFIRCQKPNDTGEGRKGAGKNILSSGSANVWRGV